MQNWDAKTTAKLTQGIRSVKAMLSSDQPALSPPVPPEGEASNAAPKMPPVVIPLEPVSESEAIQKPTVTDVAEVCTCPTHACTCHLQLASTHLFIHTQQQVQVLMDQLPTIKQSGAIHSGDTDPLRFQPLRS